MRVLHIYKSYYPDSLGGIEKTIYSLSEEMVRRGYDTTVLSLSPNPNSRSYPVGGHRGVQARRDLYLFSTGISLSFFSAFRRLARNADIIHYHFPWPWMDLACLAFGRRAKSVCTYHSDIVRQRFLLVLYRPLMRFFLGAMDRIVATSANYLGSSDVLCHYRRKTTVIPIGIDPDGFERLTVPALHAWRSRLGPKFFVFVGVLRYYKGLHILVDALEGWDAPTVIIGAGPIEHELRHQARERGLENLVFLGALSDEDKFAILTLSYAMVFPSHLRSEAFGISLLEGAMAGRPLISSELGTGTSYINVDGETGLVVEAGSAASLRAAMLKLWNDEALATRMGAAARARFEKFFSARRMGDAYERVYRELLGPLADQFGQSRGFRD